jgi:hypothetical protein
MDGLFTLINLFPTYYSKIGFLFCFSVFFISGNAQIYNIDPIRYANAEVNPSFLANEESSHQFSLLQHTSFNPELPLNFSAARYSFLLKKYFIGVGCQISNTYVNRNANYSTASFGIGYRTILFDAMYLRIGVMYKENSVKALAGKFIYGGFIADSLSEAITIKNVRNANFSFSVASNENRAYLNAGILNYSGRKMSELSPFPSYIYFNLGDLGKLLSDRQWEIFYTVFMKKYPAENNFSYSNYITILNRYLVTRESNLRYGFRGGIAENSFIQITPLLNFYQRLSRRNSFSVQFLFDITFKNSAKEKSFPNGGQLSLSYTF